MTRARERNPYSFICILPPPGSSEHNSYLKNRDTNSPFEILATLWSFPPYPVFSGTHLPFLKAFSGRSPPPSPANSHHAPYSGHTWLPIFKLHSSASSGLPTLFFGSYQALWTYITHHYTELNSYVYSKSAQQTPFLPFDFCSTWFIVH